MGDSSLRVIRGGPYKPTSPRSGNIDDQSAFRIQNMLVRGHHEAHRYWENFSGVEDLGESVEMVALTGTLALAENSVEVVGNGTLFNLECHLGQRISCIPSDNSANYPIVVQRIIDDEHMVVWKGARSTSWPTVSGLTGWQMPRLYAVNDQRGMSIWGNVQKLDRGSFLGVGSGPFYLNGQLLPGTSLVLDRHPAIALYEPLTATYTCFPLGMDTSVPPTLAAVGGGTKGMQGGNFSLVITPARKETVGYNNPSERADVTISTNDMVACTFPAMDTANGQNAWIVWVTTFADTLGADLNYLNGPWHRLRLIDTTEVSAAGGTVNLEWLDAEVENNEFVAFNNDEPTDAEFVVRLGKAPVWVSCQGQGWNLHPEATSPGPFVVPAKPNNIEAAPLELAFSSSPPETILGAVEAHARVYLLTINKLQIAQSTPSDIVPIIIRPFWQSGFANPEQLVDVDGTLYGYPVSGPTRSASDGDETFVQHEWAQGVYEVTRQWNPGQVMVGFDPRNAAVIFFHIADRLNSAGFWTTKWLAYGVSVGEWLGGGEFGVEGEDGWDEEDHIICGIATVADNLELIWSGRRA